MTRVIRHHQDERGTSVTTHDVDDTQNERAARIRKAEAQQRAGYAASPAVFDEATLDEGKQPVPYEPMMTPVSLRVILPTCGYAPPQPAE